MKALRVILALVIALGTSIGAVSWTSSKSVAIAENPRPIEQAAARSEVRDIPVVIPSTTSSSTTTTVAETTTTTTAALAPTTTLAPSLKRQIVTSSTTTTSAVINTRANCSASKQAARDCWWGLISQYSWDDERAFAIMWCESTGNPNAKNPRSTATGLFQILGGSTNPEANVQHAYEMWQKRGWQPWVCKG